MDTLYAGMEEIVNKAAREMFRQHMVTMLGPSPFCPKWPLTCKDAESMADRVIEYMDEHPSEAAGIMKEMYEVSLE
jgi:hypothetical protein